jgi:hypothetical protein
MTEKSNFLHKYRGCNFQTPEHTLAKKTPEHTRCVIACRLFRLCDSPMKKLDAFTWACQCDRHTKICSAVPIFCQYNKSGCMLLYAANIPEFVFLIRKCERENVAEPAALDLK